MVSDRPVSKYVHFSTVSNRDVWVSSDHIAGFCFDKQTKEYSVGLKTNCLFLDGQLVQVFFVKEHPLETIKKHLLKGKLE